MEKLQDKINREVKELLEQKGLKRYLYNRADFMLLSKYKPESISEKKEDSWNYNFIASDELVRICWRLAYKYGFRATESQVVLEPSCKTGAFLRYAPSFSRIVAYESDKTCYEISKLLYPTFDIRNESFENNFYIKSGRGYAYKATFDMYNLIIGIPPFIKPYDSIFSEKESKVYPFIDCIEQWYLMRGIDCLNEGGLMVTVIPSIIVDKLYATFKEELEKKAYMLDCYRLPETTFGEKDTTTDLIVLQKK